MKNSTFNWQRFLMLCRKEWLEKWKDTLLIRAAIPLVGVVLVLWWDYYLSCCQGMAGSAERWVRRSESELLTLATILFVLYTAFICSFFMRRIAYKKDRSLWLLTPASTLEKFMVPMVGVLVSLFVIFPLAMCVEEVFRVGIFSVAFPDKPVAFINISHLIGDGTDSYWTWSRDWEAFFTDGLLVLYLLCFSGIILGACIWPTYSLPITSIVGLALCILYFMTIYAWVWTLFPEGPKTVSEIATSAWAREYWFVRIADWKWLGLTLGGIAFPYFLILAYYRFKEMEIINRW